MELNELKALRGEIDRVDEQLARLFAERMRLAEEIGQVKKARGLMVRDERREAEVIAKISALAPGCARELGVIYRAVFEASRARQS